MTRIVILLAGAAALLVPTLASAQAPLTLTYRPELRQMIAVPQRPADGQVTVARSLTEEIARHEAMAHAYRGTRLAQAAAHCDRLIQQARDARTAR